MSSIPRASLAPLAGHRVAAAVSGGADSLALALWLHAHTGRAPHYMALAGLIHVNHHLRGDESDRDELFCRALSARLGVPIEVVQAPVIVSNGASGARSPEAAARAARYRAFVDAADRLSATRVATAHTADDQAETVLLRLLRGTSSRGLSGVRVQRGRYVRPLLACRRQELRAWLTAAGETWCEDATNADRSFARNRVRHDLLPLIESIAPGAVPALARAASLAQDDEDVLQREAIKLAPAIVLEEDAGGADLDLGRLRALAPALARRVLRSVLERLAPASAWAADHLEAIRRLAARGEGGGRLNLPGVHVERVSNVVRLRAGAVAPVERYAYELSVPGVVRVPEAGLEIIAAAVASKDHAGAYSLVVPADTALPLTVRNRRPGDRVQLSGGTRKVQDVMVDAKIARSERDRVPLVVAADGQILGLIGVSGASRRAAGSLEAGMVVLRFRKMERT
jgi:tRNA(Ile)-lysidine synthase